jgi:hypothetical protein
VSVQLAALIPPADPARCREFVVDTPAKMLRRNEHLSKNARRLYLAMRALADGRTGELRIGGRWLRAEAIDAAAEMCRDIRMRGMRELAAAGLVSFERERLLRVVRGRRREVLGRTRYVVHRGPAGGDGATAQGPQVVLQKSISSTVEEIDSQVFPETPSRSRASGGVVGLALLSGRRTKSSPAPRARKARDVRRTGPSHPRYEDFKDKFAASTERQFAFAVERILSRAKTPPRTLRFWQTSLINFFADLEAETDLFLTGHAVARFQSGASIGDVAESLKGEAADWDLAYGADLIDRVISQASQRFDRERALRSGLEIGAGPEAHR